MGISIIEYYDTWDSNRLRRIGFEKSDKNEFITRYEAGYFSLRKFLKKVQHERDVMGLDNPLYYTRNSEKLDYITRRFKKAIVTILIGIGLSGCDTIRKMHEKEDKQWESLSPEQRNYYKQQIRSWEEERSRERWKWHEEERRK